MNSVQYPNLISQEACESAFTEGEEATAPKEKLSYFPRNAS